MYLLAEVLPPMRRIHIPFSRDQIMLLMVAMNEFVLGLDTYLAHDISGTIRGGEWVPIIFGPIAGVLLLVAGLIAIRRRMTANVIASLVFLAGIVVGFLGFYYHLNRMLLPQAPPGQQVMACLLVYGPPLLGPMTFVLVAVLGISAAWQEDPPDSGELRLLGNLNLRMPLSKTRAYFFLMALFILATLVSSVLDHARTNFENPWLWLPITAGVFATLVATSMGAYRQTGNWDLWTYIGAMTLLIVTGLIGAYLHVDFNRAGQGAFILERFIRGAPVLAPQLYANMGALGLIVLLDPKEE
jgi:hypothetical protein